MALSLQPRRCPVRPSVGAHPRAETGAARRSKFGYGGALAVTASKGRIARRSSCRLGQRLGCDAVGQDARDQLRVAVLLIASDLAVSEVDDEGIVVVVALAVASEVSASGLKHDDV